MRGLRFDIRLQLGGFVGFLRNKLSSMTAAIVVALVSLFGMSAGEVDAAESKAEAPVIAIYTEGGFVGPVWSQSRLPQVAVYADGRVFSASSSSSPSYLHQAKVGFAAQTLVTEWVSRLVLLSKAPKEGWGFPGVADVPSTRIVLNGLGAHANVSVYALNFTNGLTQIQKRARTALTAQIAAIKVGKTSIYRPRAYELWTWGSPVDHSSSAGIPPWPVGYSQPTPSDALVGAGCMVMGSATVNGQLALPLNPDADGQWLLPSGQTLGVTLRPLLPGEKGCHRNR